MSKRRLPKILNRVGIKTKNKTMKNLEKLNKAYLLLLKLEKVTETNWSLLIYSDESGHFTHYESDESTPFENLEIACEKMQKEIAFFNSILHNILN